MTEDLSTESPTPPVPSMRRNSMAAFLSAATGVVIGLIVSVLVGRSLGPGGKGSFDLAVTTAGLIGLALSLSIASGISYAVARGSADPHRMARLAYPFAAIQAVLTLALLLVGATLAPGDFGGFDASALLAIAAMVGVGSLTGNLRGVIVGLQMVVTVAWLDLLGRILVGAGILLVIVAAPYAAGAPVTYESMLWATVVAGCGLCIALAAVVHSSSTHREVAYGLRSVLGFALPAHLSNLVQFLNYRLDVFLVSAFTGLAAVGVYALAVSFAQMVWLAPSAIALPLLPRIAAESSSGSPATDIGRLSRMSLIVSVAAAIGLALLAPPFMALAYGPGFAGATPQLLLLLPGVAVFGQATVLAAYIGGAGRQRLNFYVALVALVVTIALDLALIPPFGGAGASVATSLSYMCTAVLTLLVAARVATTRVADLLIPRWRDIEDLTGALVTVILRRP